MTMKLLALAAMAAAAAPSVAAPPPPPHEFARQLRGLDDVQRRAVLRNAVVSSGQRCGRLETGVLKGPLRNLDMWSVRCVPGGEYGVFVGSDSSAQVRTCTDLVKLRLPTCNLPAAAPAATRPSARR